MDIRYMGFEQQKNARSYRFDVVVKGQPNRRCVVTADLALFLTNRVALQDGPTLSATKLTADLESNQEGDHQLTDHDLRLHTQERRLAEAARVEKRQQRSNFRAPGL